MECKLCWDYIDNDEKLYNLKNELVCDACYDIPIIADLNNKVELENILHNILDQWYDGIKIWEWEGRKVYDLENIINCPIVLKELNNRSGEIKLNYQNFVENYIFDNMPEYKWILWNIYNNPLYSDIYSNDFVFMEKCDILYEWIFSCIDLRDKESYNYLINDDFSINISRFNTMMIDRLTENLNYDKIDINNIWNKDDLIKIASYFTMIWFLDNIDELQSEWNKDINITLDLINNTYMPLFLHQLFTDLRDKFNLSGYDLSIWTQWGISRIDNNFKLIDFWGWLQSQDIYNSLN